MKKVEWHDRKQLNVNRITAWRTCTNTPENSRYQDCLHPPFGGLRVITTKLYPKMKKKRQKLPLLFSCNPHFLNLGSSLPIKWDLICILSWCQCTKLIGRRYTSLRMLLKYKLENTIQFCALLDISGYKKEK